MKKKKILVSGGKGLLAQEIYKHNQEFKIILLSKNEMNVTNRDQIEKQILIHKPDIFLHCAAMTHPMEGHRENPVESIENNIIGSANVAAICANKNIKLVYISTDWVYPNRMNNHEEEPLLPTTNYGWSKLGGECAIQMISDHLILRCSFTRRPYKFSRAFVDVYKSYLYVDEIAPLILKLIAKECEGIYNVCGKTTTAYDFAKRSNPEVGKIRHVDVAGWIPDRCAMSNTKLIKAKKEWLKEEKI